MKRIIRYGFIAAMVMLWGEVFPQGSSLTVIADNNEKFNLEVNGNMENASPQSKVTVYNLFGPTIKVKIFIEGAEVAPVSKSIFNKPNAQFYYVLHRNMKGIYVIDPVSSDYTPSGSNAAAATTSPSKEEKAVKEPEKEKSTGKTSGCADPLTPEEFAVFYASASARPFEPTRLTAAKNIAKEKCITVEQLIDLIGLLDLEPSKLDLAKYAYLYVHDPDNYSKVDGVFLSSSSVESLHKYMESKK